MKKFSLFLAIAWLILGALNISVFVDTHDSDKLMIAFLDLVLALDNYMDYKI